MRRLSLYTTGIEKDNNFNIIYLILKIREENIPIMERQTCADTKSTQKTNYTGPEQKLPTVCHNNKTKCMEKRESAENCRGTEEPRPKFYKFQMTTGDNIDYSTQEFHLS